jgi:hypothetical protein
VVVVESVLVVAVKATLAGALVDAKAAILFQIVCIIPLIVWFVRAGVVTSVPAPAEIVGIKCALASLLWVLIAASNSRSSTQSALSEK